MNLLRRMLGLSANSSTTSVEERVTITQGEPEPIRPPEPIIEKPRDAQTPGSSAEPQARRPDTDELSEDDTVVGQTRQLPPFETVVPLPGQRLTFGQLSDVGMVRSNNQDAMYSLIASSSSSDDLVDVGLFVVADGMGGHHDGEKASAITTRIVARNVVDAIVMGLLDQVMDDPERPSISEVLREAVQTANETVTKKIPEGGTTVTIAVIIGDLAYIAHVGDSSAYLITQDSIEQVTRDHSLVQRLIELDQLTLEEAAEHPQRNVLYRAIGQSETLDVDAITRRLPPRARLVLCSDGLWNLVSEQTIHETVLRHSNPQEACNKLVEMANERGGPDNITVILVQVPG